MAGSGLVGVAFGPGGAWVVASNHTAYRFDTGRRFDGLTGRCRASSRANRSRTAQADGDQSLKRVLGAGDLVMLAIGAVIGAGIFGAIGTAAAGQVGPGRRGRALRRRPRAGPVVPAARRGVRAGRAVLRRAGGHDSAGRQRLRLCLRHAGRTGGLDHRLGPDPRVRRRQRGRGHLVGRLLQRRCCAAWASRCRRG